MLFQSPKPINKNIENENISLTQSIILNQNYNSYYNYNINYSKYYMETPEQMNKYQENYIVNNYDIENSFNKDTYYKAISSSIKKEIKNSENNINFLNTPKFEKICYKIFFPKDDPFHLSSSKKSPKKIEIQKTEKPPLILQKENNISININNINYSKTRKNNNLNYSSSQIKKDENKNICSLDIKRNFSEKIIKNKNKKINSTGVSTKKNKKNENELRSLLENVQRIEKIDTNNYEDILSNSSTKAKTRIISEKKIRNRKVKKKFIRYSKRAKKYNILTEEIKRKLLLDAKHMRTIDVAKKYGISTRNINRWKKIGVKRKRGSGRKFKDPDLEKKIIIWYNFQDKKNVTSKIFREKALELSNNNSFRASSGWLTIMKKKYRIKFKKN